MHEGSFLLPASRARNVGGASCFVGGQESHTIWLSGKRGLEARRSRSRDNPSLHGYLCAGMVCLLLLCIAVCCIRRNSRTDVGLE